MRDPADLRNWPWLVGLVVAVLGIWVLLELVDTTRPPEPEESVIPATSAQQSDAEDSLAGRADTVPPPASETTDPVVPASAAEEVVDRVEGMRAAVRRYEEDCAHRPPPVSGTRERNLVATCMERLAHAIDAVLASDPASSLDAGDVLDRQRRQAGLLRESSAGAGYAGTVREALLATTDLIARIRSARYPETLEDPEPVEQLRSVAGSLDPHRSVDAQEETFTAYFRDAATILSAMTRPADPGPGDDTSLPDDDGGGPGERSG